MSTEPPVEFVERQEWLEPAENAIQKAVAGAFQNTGATGRKLQNFLHGTWLGHPLHPVLTDVPIGAWTAATVLDVMDAAGHKGCRAGADAAVKIGLVGASCAAVAGITDWHVTDGGARRVGMAHALLNTIATGLYTASMIARTQRKRDAGRVLAFAGFAVSMASAYLGGNLVYAKQIGVNHTIGQDPPEQWTAVMDERDLPQGIAHRATVNGTRLLLFRTGSQVDCIVEVCSHLGGPLAEGEIKDGTVTCPWHGSKFCLRDGSVIDGPATHPQPTLETRIQDGRVEVKVRDRE